MHHQRAIGLTLLIALISLLILQPIGPRSARAQDSDVPNPYIDALGTQAALNTQATLAAYQQQQGAASAQSAAAAAQSAAAQAQANAAYAAQQATLQAGQQQAALVAAQSTADAAALQATAIVQQTRTALEISAQQTREAASVRTTATASALQARSTQVAIEATRAANQARQRDDEAIATSVVISVQATKSALDLQAHTDAEQAATAQRTNAIGSLVLTSVMIIAGAMGALVIGKFALGLWRSRALNPVPSIAPLASTAAHSVVDAQTGAVTSRLAVIEYNDDPQRLSEWLRSIYGHD